MLAIFVGYHVVWNVTPALHTPLMAVTNAISGIIIVGAMLAAGPEATGAGSILQSMGMASGPQKMDIGTILGLVAVTLAAVNVFGGFLVTQRMLEMFKKKNEVRERSCRPILLHSLISSPRLFIQALKGLSPDTARRGNMFGMIGMAHRGADHAASVTHNVAYILIAIAASAAVSARSSRSASR